MRVLEAMSLAATQPQLPLPTTATLDLYPTWPSLPPLFPVSVLWGIVVPVPDSSSCGTGTCSKAGAMETGKGEEINGDKWKEEKMSGNEEMKEVGEERRRII